MSTDRTKGPRRIGSGVRDSGLGIDEDLADRLFVPLTTSKGLGLSICAAIVESHGRRVWLQARAAGATEFRLSLPLEGH